MLEVINISVFTVALYVAAFVSLAVSLLKDKSKTALALKKAWKSFEGILPLFLSIILVIGMMLSVLSPAVISKLIGRQSGFMGILLAAMIGSVTLIPGIVTFPLASALLKSGAGFEQIVMFISASMMVGVVTIPVEIKYLGRKATYARNLLALVFSFAVAFLMGVLLR